jgi:hypothetical protein
MDLDYESLKRAYGYLKEVNNKLSKRNLIQK